MEKFCENCEYFVQAKTGPNQHARGRCMKPETGITDKKRRNKGVFRWANGTCIDFKPKQKLD